MKALPLETMRVIDLTMWFAGPFATQLLADMGAEIIKIESIQTLDGWRGGRYMPQAEKLYEAASVFNGVNRNKHGITLDLGHPLGARLFKELVKVGDVVIENYTPRVMKNFGLDYPALKEINPAIIMVSMPGFGTTGPWKDYVAFAFLVEEMSGIPQLTGYPGGRPMLMAWSVADSIAGANAAFAILTALEHRRKTGQGQFIDLSQVEALTCLNAEPLLDSVMNNRIRPRMGNRHPFMVPHGVYRCQGEDQWVAISVSSDKEWEAFCNALGDPPWAREERFSSPLGRWRNQGELDRCIEEWTCHHDHYEVMHTLQRAGVSSGPVLSPAELLGDPHLRERGFFEVVHRAVVGAHSYPGMYAKLSKAPGKIRRPAPCLGEHNAYVLGELIGLSKEEMSRLEETQVIGTVPLARQKRAV